MCVCECRSAGGILRNSIAAAAAHLPRPKLTTIWAAGLSFSKCHAELATPYDPHLPEVFDGEEISKGESCPLSPPPSSTLLCRTKPSSTGGARTRRGKGAVSSPLSYLQPSAHKPWSLRRRTGARGGSGTAVDARVRPVHAASQLHLAHLQAPGACAPHTPPSLHCACRSCRQ